MDHIEIKIITKETIKPSSPTPKSLQKYQLSFLDQVAPPVFMPVIYFYNQPNSTLSNSQKSSHLKNSLSQVLQKYYPLAGRLADDGLHVDCNDAGTPFFEAEANCTLSQFLTKPNPKLMTKFLPYKLDDVQNLNVAVQITFFTCGGLAVALVMSHKLADGLSLFVFARSWAAGSAHPKFCSAEIFPPRSISGFRASAGIVDSENLAVKIFTFPDEKISLLREMYTGGRIDPSTCPPTRVDPVTYTPTRVNPVTHTPTRVDLVTHPPTRVAPSARPPTRVEALSAFIWSRFVSAVGTRSDPDKIHIVLHTVNLRTRMDPPLSELHFGNLSRLAIAVPSADDGGFEILQKVREAIRAVDGDFVARLRNGDEHLNYIKELAGHASKGELVPFNFTSLCRFPLYEADFGWGRPVWVGSAPFVYANVVSFVDTPSGDGIEAWINMKKEDMEKFEADLELQKFVA